MNYENIMWLTIIVMVLTAITGIALGLYLSKYANKIEDEEYEHESSYCDKDSK